MYNTLAYSLYFVIMAFIILRVGWLFYHHGQHYVAQLFPDDLSYGAWLNSLLLKAYYLFNLGYVAISISTWQSINSPEMLIEQLAAEVGLIVMMLAFLHYANLAWLALYSSYKQRTQTV